MSEAKHTAGPWFADADGRIWRRHPSELYENGGGVAGDKPLAVAHKGWHRDDEIGYPIDANARLIAAAPELLEALEGILRADEWVSDASLAQDHELQRRAPKLHEESMDKARAAIAKAKGVQP